MFYKLSLTVLFLLINIDLHSQVAIDKAILIGSCEGCEAVFEYGDRELTPTDTLPDFNNEGPKIKISGTIYKSDGITPAENVILYVYHTNQEGIYEPKENSTGWEKRHGYIRGWIKTGSDGKYSFYTLKPGAYPNRNQPAHIHPTILEPNGKYYWLESYFFKDDPILQDFEHLSETPRGGGNNILELKQEGELLVGERDFILGRNVPNYD